jgi:hypothetical protein
MNESKQKTEAKTEKEFDIKEIYTPLSVAKKEIWRRWNDKALRKKVEDFLGGDVPEVLKKEPKAIITQYVASPNFEFFYFLDLAKLAELDPVCLEYLGDKFVAENECKYHICKLFFLNGKGNNGGYRISAIKAIDFTEYQGKTLNKLKTLWGEDFINLHHRILKEVVPTFEKNIFDITSWYKRKGAIAEKYYINFMTLLVCNGILFDNYLFNKNEKKFIEKIIVPNFKKVSKIFGVKPLIVSLAPIKYEDDIYWRCYPSFLKKNIIKK